MQNNMMRRHQMGLVFEAIKLLLLLVSGWLTYQFLGRFMPNMWERVASLAMYELGLLAWHYIHHYKSETPRQHMFSKNMEKLCLQTGMISAALAQVDTVKVVEADEHSAALPGPSEADADTPSNGDSAAHKTLQKVVKMLPNPTKRVRLEDRELALESLASAHPELSVKDLAQQVGLSESTVRQWKKGR